MNILVTGGSGFIGSHLVDKLVEQGFGVKVFDKLRPLREDVEWFQGDLLNEKNLLDVCKDVEVIYHLAAVSDVNVAISHPDICLRENEDGILNLLKAALAIEVERVILASSTWVYGKKEIVDENTPTSLPEHIYTKTKIGQEHLLYAWNKHYGLPYTILRYDIPYGPRMRSNMAISTFVHRALRGAPISIFGDGNQGRCFIYVEDLAEGNIAALKENAKNQIFNIAGSEFITINQIVEHLKKFFNINVKYEAPRPDDFKGVKVNIDKAKKLLGWEPTTPFKTGLRKYIKSEKTK